MKSLRGILSGIFTATTLAILKVPASIAQAALNSSAQAAHGNGAFYATFTDTGLLLMGVIAVVIFLMAEQKIGEGEIVA